MNSLDIFENHIAFDSTYSLRGVNTLDQTLVEYNQRDDIDLCKHSFYGGKHDFKILRSNPKQLSKRGRSRQKPKLSKSSKNKTNKRMN